MQFYLLTIQDTCIKSTADFLAIDGKTDNFILAADLDFTSVTDYQPITFSGTFDGRGYTISNINIDKAFYRSEVHHLGVFANLCNVTIIKNIHLSKIMVDFTKTDIAHTNQLNAAILVSSYQGNVQNVSITDSSIKLNTNANMIFVGTLISLLTSGNIILNNISIDNQKIQVINLQIINPYAMQIGGVVGLSRATLTVITSFIKYSVTATTFNIVNIGGIVGKTMKPLTIKQTVSHSLHIQAPHSKQLNFAAFIANAGKQIVIITDVKSYTNCNIGELISDICGINCDKLKVQNSLAIYEGESCILKKSNIWQDEKDHTLNCINCYVTSDLLTQNNVISQQIYNPTDCKLSDQENWQQNDSSKQHELVIPDNMNDSPDYGIIIPPTDSCKTEKDQCAPNANCEIVEMGSIHYFQCRCNDHFVSINNTCQQTGCLVNNVICNQNYNFCINGTCQIPDSTPSDSGDLNENNNGFNIGFIVGCVVGCLLLILLIVLLVYFLYCKKINASLKKNNANNLTLKPTTDGASQKTKSTTPPKPQQVKQLKQNSNQVNATHKKQHVKPLIEKSKITQQEIVSTQQFNLDENNQYNTKKAYLKVKNAPKKLIPQTQNSNTDVTQLNKANVELNTTQQGRLKPIRNKMVQLKKITNGDQVIVL